MGDFVVAEEVIDKKVADESCGIDVRCQVAPLAHRLLEGVPTLRDGRFEAGLRLLFRVVHHHGQIVMVADEALGLVEVDVELQQHAALPVDVHATLSHADLLREEVAAQVFAVQVELHGGRMSCKGASRHACSLHGSRVDGQGGVDVIGNEYIVAVLHRAEKLLLVGEFQPVRFLRIGPPRCVPPSADED